MFAILPFFTCFVKCFLAILYQLFVALIIYKVGWKLGMELYLCDAKLAGVAEVPNGVLMFCTVNFD
jgi:hypothetical protein